MSLNEPSSSNFHLTPDEYGQVRELFHAICDLRPEARGDFLNALPTERQFVRRELESLLNHDGAGNCALRSVFSSLEADQIPLDDLQANGPRIPQSIAYYRILEVIGEGGMGIVYRAEQEHPQRIVAIKVMRAGIVSVRAKRRFEFETQVLGRLQHPGIAQIHEAGTHTEAGHEQPFFAMEYVDGAQSLTRFARHRNLSTRERLDLFARVCDAIQHGHQKGVIHRDIKPGNILVDAGGHPKIIDFGVARALETDVTTLTLV